MRVTRRHRTRTVRCWGPRHLCFYSGIRDFCRCSSGFRLRGGGFFRAKCFDPGCLEARSFSRRGFLLRHKFCRGLCRLRSGSGLLFSRCLDVSSFSPATDWICGSNNWLGNWLRRRRCPTATRRRRRRCLFLCAVALFTLPPSANACDLVVGEHAHMATNRDIHRPKK